ncbi:potassium channel family protein [Terrabacter sp. Soil810]|uniref:potassium channel family protein n=1 Tax=Terrabacter sp. Soil810 TaxID=1736418 RepID=UPI00070A06EF|nr:potassium channel family protein [Terrabacter sp. Soil810]KRF38083.1 hypothetical protein ASG96_16495 [Terrabacter sp. Soil810]
MAEPSSGHEGDADAPTTPARPSRESRQGRRDRLIRAPLLDRFGLVLILVLITIAVQGLVDVRGSLLAQLFAHAISGLALIAAVRASGARRRWRHAVYVFVGVVVIISVATLSWHRADGSSTVPPETAWLLAAALTPVLIARRVLQHTVVTIQTIMGSVAAYLQLAVAYAFLFQTIDAYTVTPFFGEDVSTTTYMYFSLVTISTVGYGDVAAVADLGRMAAASEAVIGQVYLVTFVALIVSRFAAGMPRGSAGAPVEPRSGPVPRTLFEALDASRSNQAPPDPDPDEDEEDGGPDRA